MDGSPFFLMGRWPQAPRYCRTSKNWCPRPHGSHRRVSFLASPSVDHPRHRWPFCSRWWEFFMFTQHHRKATHRGFGPLAALKIACVSAGRDADPISPRRYLKNLTDVDQNKSHIFSRSMTWKFTRTNDVIPLIDQKNCRSWHFLFKGGGHCQHGDENHDESAVLHGQWWWWWYLLSYWMMCFIIIKPSCVLSSLGHYVCHCHSYHC